MRKKTFSSWLHGKTDDTQYFKRHVNKCPSVKMQHSGFICVDISTLGHQISTN